MSIEIWQFPKVASREELVSQLESMGFEVGDNPFWPGPKGVALSIGVEGFTISDVH